MINRVNICIFTNVYYISFNASRIYEIKKCANNSLQD